MLIPYSCIDIPAHFRAIYWREMKGVFFASFPTESTGIPREAMFFATFRAADDREFRVETGNPESSLRPIRKQTRQDGSPMYSFCPDDGRVDR